jgi:hypothetical protein
MQLQLKCNDLPWRTEAQSQHVEPLTRRSAQTWPTRLALLVVQIARWVAAARQAQIARRAATAYHAQIARRVAAARHQRPLPWWYDPGA